MKKLVAMLVFALLVVTCGQAFAALSDTRATIAAQYGEYRMVVDIDGQLWTKEEWEHSGHKKAKAGGFMHYFDRGGMAIQTEVAYDGDKPASYVRAQRFTPVGIIRIKDLQKYLPEIYALVASPKAEVFTSHAQVTRSFREDRSPVTLGVVVKQPVPGQPSWYTLVAFNVKDEGRLLKDAKFLTKEAFINEISVERVYRVDLEDPLGYVMQWDWAKTNIFK